jgi:hypothetical protein
MNTFSAIKFVSEWATAAKLKKGSWQKTGIGGIPCLFRFKPETLRVVLQIFLTETL